MPRRPAVARATPMDARVSALKAIIASIHSIIDEAMNSSIQTAVSEVLESKLPVHLDNHLPMYFGQFDRKLSFRLEGESSSAPILPNPFSLHELNSIQLPQSPNWIGGGYTPHQSWTLRVDFPHFVDSDDLLAWIYKAN